MQDSKNISIGQGKWINWVDLDTHDNNLFDIDKFLVPTMEFWSRLETECVAECCGIDAFALWSDDIKNAVTNLDIAGMKDNFEIIRRELIQSDCKTVVSKRLNNLFDKNVFLQLIDHIQSCL